MKSLKSAGLALTLATAGLLPAFADSLAFNETGGTFTSNGPKGTGATGFVGFNFTVTSPIKVTQLGFFGAALGGGDTPWVALFDITNSSQLAAVTTFSPQNGWSYVTLATPVTLTPGDTYQVTATAYWSPKYTGDAGFVYGPRIKPLGFTTPTGWSGWGTPAMAGATYAAAPNIAANFVYVPATAATFPASPGPASVASANPAPAATGSPASAPAVTAAPEPAPPGIPEPSSYATPSSGNN